MTKPCHAVLRPVRARAVVDYPGYFCNGQTVGVIGRYRSARLGVAMVHIVAKYRGGEIEVALPADKIASIQRAEAAA